MYELQLQLLKVLLSRVLGHRPSPATIWRWTTKGVKVGDHRVKLRAVRIGGKLYSTVEDIDEFIAAQNPAPDDNVKAGDARDDATTRLLESAGLL